MSYKEFLKKYGKIKVVFESYYKYSFKFLPLETFEIEAVYKGGTSSDIYRLEINASEEYTIIEIEPERVAMSDGTWLEFDY